jgi:hypothetical protein
MISKQKSSRLGACELVYRPKDQDGLDVVNTSLRKIIAYR